MISSAALQLAKNGQLLVEIGHDQSTRVKQLLDDSGFYQDIRFVKDYAGHLRVVQREKTVIKKIATRKIIVN